MAPTRTKKTKVSTDSDLSTRRKVVTTKSPGVTPQRSPQKRVMTITEAQKQSLIDNLQLEVTERARKLRAQYSLQAQSLRTRIELRLNRIPNALRKANMGELFAKYTETPVEKPKAVAQAPEVAKPSKASPSDPVSIEEPQPPNSTAASKPKGTKRSSDAIDSEDKENDDTHTQPIPNPKKRPKASKATNPHQPPNPSTVLSPKSANSRTLPHSPIRPPLTSPQKSYTSHPASPLKATSPLKIVSPVKATAAAAAPLIQSNPINQKAKPGRPKAGTAKTGNRALKHNAEPTHEPENVRKASNTSTVSTATTIVRNTRKAPPAGARKGELGIKAVGRKGGVRGEAPATGRRVLRKRG